MNEWDDWTGLDWVGTRNPVRRTVIPHDTRRLAGPLGSLVRLWISVMRGWWAITRIPGRQERCIFVRRTLYVWILYYVSEVPPYGVGTY